MSNGVLGPVEGGRIGNIVDPPEENIPSAIIVQAIELGYRHFQTAFSEHAAIGEAIAQALERGLVSTRADLFITCKIHPYHDDDVDNINVLKDFNNFLEKAGLEYIDLCLVELPEKSEEAADETSLVTTWSAVEECQQLGLTKSVGVCNFSSKMLDYILQHASIPPSLNQVGVDMLLREDDDGDVEEMYKIPIVASYSIVEEKENHLSSVQLMDSDFLDKIAKDGHELTDRVVIRWAYERGAILLMEGFDKVDVQEILNIYHDN